MIKSGFQANFKSERFQLVSLNRWQALQLTYPWTKDSDFMSTYYGSSEHISRWKWYRRMTRPNKSSRFVHAIIPHGQTTPIGAHSMILKPYKMCTIAIGISDRSWWGKDVAYEVFSRIIDHVFEHSDVEKIHTFVFGRNFPSLFNVRKLGFTHVGTHHRVMQDKATGVIHDMLYFEMFRDEWMERKALANAE